MGQDLYKEYKAEDVLNGVREKEFSLPSLILLILKIKLSMN
ncbi:TPA: hypothetical protein TXL60_001880 [Streptococcus suis]|nr:hypothetical protein [Streptococcus suis]